MKKIEQIIGKLEKLNKNINSIFTLQEEDIKELNVIQMNDSIDANGRPLIKASGRSQVKITGRFHKSLQVDFDNLDFNKKTDYKFVSAVPYFEDILNFHGWNVVGLTSYNEDIIKTKIENKIITTYNKI